MSLKAKIEAIIYAAEEPITVEQISTLVKDLVIAEQAQAQAIAQQVEPSAEAEQSELTTEPASAEFLEQQIAAEVPVEAATESPADAAAAESAPHDSPTEENAPAPDEAPVEASATVEAKDETAAKKKPKKELSEDAKIRAYVRNIIEQLIAEYDSSDRGMEIRAIAGGYRMATRPEHHDVVRAFAKSLKPPVRLSLAALETLAVIAYKQPVTVPEISEIRGVEAGGVIGTLLERKLITTAGRKQVVGRPILYKTSKDFLLRFGLNDINELPSMEEFEKLAADQGDLFEAPAQSTSGATSTEETAPVAGSTPDEAHQSNSAEESEQPIEASAEVTEDASEEAESTANNS